MATLPNDEEAQQQKQPLLDTTSKTSSSPSDAAATTANGNTTVNGGAAADVALTPVQRAISQTFQSTAHLANLLPTGTILAFQLLSPVFTNQGQCVLVNRAMTGALIAVCGLICFILSFSDSFKDPVTEKVRYGFATSKGLWVVDGGSPPPDDPANYKIKALDFIHGFVSLLIFAAVALLDQNVVNCFYPVPSESTKQVLGAMPVGIGVLGSALFVVFPTSRHGIGFPVTSK